MNGRKPTWPAVLVRALPPSPNWRQATISETTLTCEQLLGDETRYTMLRCLEENPGASQRELAKELGISLGKTNYCLKALLNQCYIKAVNFKSSKNKRWRPA